jgi:choline dehydrogenase-like flavoprotein
MDIEDLRRLDDGQDIVTDLCVVGSGPAGLTIAREFFGTNVKVLVLESGGLTEDAAVDKLSQIESVGAPRVMDQTLVRNRIFGGSSHSWSGRCAPFDDLDFAARPWVPHSGWPIKRPALDPFLERACRHIGLVHHVYDERLWRLSGRVRNEPPIDSDLLKHCFWQYSSDSRRPLDYMRFGPSFMSATEPNTRILLNATTTQLQTNDTGSRIVALEVMSLDGRRATIRPQAVVLCAGGIENARIMLYSNRQIAGGVGNQHQLVGRYLMDHLRCTLGEFGKVAIEAARDRFGIFRIGDARTGHFFAPGIGLSPQAQKQMELLNCAAWITEDRAPDDPFDAAKRILYGRKRRLVRDSRWVLSQPLLMIRGASDRLLLGKGLPHKLRRLRLDSIVEQRPDPDSRILLSEKKDRLGLPVARLDWRISQQEKATAIAFSGILCDEFERIGLPAPTPAEWIREQQLDQASFVDASHPTGTTRMSTDPRSGVVDMNCQVHDLDNLYVAGSSVFPTAGHANPTLMIVALAIRVADHLKRTNFERHQTIAAASRTLVN